MAILSLASPPFLQLWVKIPSRFIGVQPPIYVSVLQMKFSPWEVDGIRGEHSKLNVEQKEEDMAEVVHHVTAV